MIQMKWLRSGLRTASFGVLTLMTSTTLLAEPAPLIPMQDFFRNPEQTGYQISPDGTKLSWLAPFENRLNVHVQTIGEEAVTRITEETDRDIYSYFWVSNERIVYLQDDGGDENTHVFAVNIDGSDFAALTPFPEVRVNVVDDLENDPAHMIVQMNKRDPRLFDVFRLNLIDGELELLVENPGNFVGYETDHTGAVRIAYVSDGVNNQVLYREQPEDEWEMLLETSWKDIFSVAQFTYDNDKFWAITNLGRDKAGLVLFDPKTKTVEETLFSHPQVDLLSAHFSDQRKILTSVSFLAAYRTFVYFDPVMERIHRKLEDKLAPLQVRFADASKDEKKWLITTFSDKDLGSYYFYDVETEELTHLSDNSPWLNAADMADMEPVTYESRDGLFIHGYLTLPKGLEPKNLPLVVNPHGGPQARDSWGFRTTPQFLANRGYAVLQMNFRGSTGYGREFMEAGFGEWGQKMQNDITDGVHYLVEQGIVDPDRVGIYGASYGGYATLAGVTFTPDVYAAGVSYVGPSSLFTLIDSIPPYWEPFREQLYEMTGHPVEQEALVRAASPLYHIDAIDDPLLILQGANDPRVKQAESDQIVAALRAKGIDTPYMLKTNEGHGFANEENQFDANRALEQFFGKHLGGRVEDGDDILSTLYDTVLAPAGEEPES